ncbi:MAG: hypothetical protein ACR5LG_11430 [Sodalis sp. (in: enterobacteria)]|uniref:hypothetical protein n=1 Tax=Sodalis sp. (in: enterobacteria) TaxID=1898979 RepID=UPI003F2B9735
MTIGVYFYSDLKLLVMRAAELANLTRRRGVIDNNFQIAALATQRQYVREFAGGNINGVQNIADPGGKKHLGFFQR